MKRYKSTYFLILSLSLIFLAAFELASAVVLLSIDKIWPSLIMYFATVFSLLIASAFLLVANFIKKEAGK